VGHLKKVCRQPSQPEKSSSQNKGRVNVMQGPSDMQGPSETTDSSQTEYQLFAVTSGTSNSPLLVEMTLGGQPHTMEIDTGASVSVISKTTYQREFSLRITSYRTSQCV